MHTILIGYAVLREIMYVKDTCEGKTFTVDCSSRQHWRWHLFYAKLLCVCSCDLIGVCILYDMAGGEGGGGVNKGRMVE